MLKSKKKTAPPAAEFEPVVAPAEPQAENLEVPPANEPTEPDNVETSHPVPEYYEPSDPAAVRVELEIPNPTYEGAQVLEVVEYGVHGRWHRCKMSDLTTKDVPIARFSNSKAATGFPSSTL